MKLKRWSRCYQWVWHDTSHDKQLSRENGTSSALFKILVTCIDCAAPSKYSLISKLERKNMYRAVINCCRKKWLLAKKAKFEEEKYHFQALFSDKLIISSVRFCYERPCQKVRNDSRPAKGVKLKCWVRNKRGWLENWQGHNRTNKCTFESS